MSGKGFEINSAPSSDSPDIRSEFFKLYKQEAEAHDLVFLTKYSDDLGNTLIFAGLLSAVSSAFIINVLISLQPDNTATTAALLKILIHTIDNSTFPGIDLTPPQWTGPSNTNVVVQTLLCLSLTASLLAAFLAMLGKQWVNRYVKGKRGTLLDYCRDRQRKLDGIEKWMFHAIMEILPLMLQLALLLLGIALSQYMWGFSRIASTVIIGVTAFGVLFYVFVVLSATFFDYCPFQTPASQILRYLIDSRRSPSQMWFTLVAHLKSILAFVSPYAIKAKRWLIKSLMGSNYIVFSDVHPWFNDGHVDLSGNKLDAHCIMWMHETSTDPAVAVTAMQFISEVEWSAGVDVFPPLAELAANLRRYCDTMTSHPSTIPSTKDKAYETAKAFLHLYVQRRCVNERDISNIGSVDVGGDVLGCHPGGWDNDLEFTLWMIDCMVQGYESMVWPGFNEDIMISIPHLSWVSRVLLYYMHSLVSCRQLTDDVQEDLDRILEKFWSCRATLSLSTIADCILICGLSLGLQIDLRDLSVTDKSQKIRNVIGKLYDLIQLLFQKHPPRRQVERALRVLRFLTLWKDGENLENKEAVATFTLCNSILDSSVHDDQKWGASRLVMQIGFRYRESKSLGSLSDDATVCITHLMHHLANEPHHHDSIADAFHALTMIHRDYPLQVDYLGQKTVVQWICSAWKNPSEERLHRVALRFVYLISAVIGHPANAVAQNVFIDHGFPAALKLELEGVAPTTNTEVIGVYLSILGCLSLSPIWHSHLLRDYWDVFDYATTGDLDWLDRLLTGNCARKMYGWKALAKFIHIAWRTNLHSPNYLRIVGSTVNLLVMVGKPAAHELMRVVRDSLRWAEDEQETLVLNGIVKFFEDIETFVPSGWGSVVVSKARKRKTVKRMRRKRNELHYCYAGDLC